MTTTATDPAVLAAEAAADEAEALVTAIEDRIMAGDETATHDELSNQISLARFARKFVEGARNKAALSRAATETKKRKTLRSEILTDCATDGEKLSILLASVLDAANQFKTAADEQHARVIGWNARANGLDVPIGAEQDGFEGLSLNHAGAIRIDGQTLEVVSAANYLGLIFDQLQNRGLLPTSDSKVLESVNAQLLALGTSVA